MHKRINVTKSFLPPLEEYQEYLKIIWDNEQLTNQGPLLKEFEAKASEYLGVENFHFVTNGTIALQVALKALGIEDGEVITTPFTYVATTSAIMWERCTPVYVDIDPKTLNIDPSKIEEAITPNTKAILAVHVFGNPCDVEAIEEIAKKHNLKVIYDAAHAFGVQYKGKSLLDYGDISICSFHATKLFHTIEGGALVIKDKRVSDVVELTKRFGHDGDDHKQLGINAKSDEFRAAMGLCNLRYVDRIIEDRKRLHELYDEHMHGAGQKQYHFPGVTYNYSYYPIILNSQSQLIEALGALEKDGIYPRRYFYPSLNTLKYLDKNPKCPISEEIAGRILCLPLYVGLESDEIKKICTLLGEI